MWCLALAQLNKLLYVHLTLSLPWERQLHCFITIFPPFINLPFPKEDSDHILFLFLLLLTLHLFPFQPTLPFRHLFLVFLLGKQILRCLNYTGFLEESIPMVNIREKRAFIWWRAGCLFRYGGWAFYPCSAHLHYGRCHRKETWHWNCHFL